MADKRNAEKKDALDKNAKKNLEMLQYDRNEMTETNRKLNAEVEELDHSFAVSGVTEEALFQGPKNMSKMIRHFERNTERSYKALTEASKSAVKMSQSVELASLVEENADEEEDLSQIEGMAAAIGPMLSDLYKNKIDSTTSKLNAIFNRSKKQYNDVLKSIIPDDLVETSGKSEDVDIEVAIIPMLQQRIESLRQELKVAETKARELNIQWSADRAKHGDIVIEHKNAISALEVRLIVAESRKRREDQVSRDDNMISSAVSRADLEAAILECENLKNRVLALEAENIPNVMQIKSLNSEIAQVQTDLQLMTTMKMNFEKRVEELKQELNRSADGFQRSEKEYERRIQDLETRSENDRISRAAQLDGVSNEYLEVEKAAQLERQRLTTKIGALQSEVIVSNEAVELLTKELEVARQNAQSRLSADLSSALQTIEDMKVEKEVLVEESERKQSSLVEKIEDQSKKERDLKDEIISLRKAIEEAQEKADKAAADAAAAIESANIGKAAVSTMRRSFMDISEAFEGKQKDLIQKAQEDAIAAVAAVEREEREEREERRRSSVNNAPSTAAHAEEHSSPPPLVASPPAPAPAIPAGGYDSDAMTSDDETQDPTNKRRKGLQSQSQSRKSSALKSRKAVKAGGGAGAKTAGTATGDERPIMASQRDDPGFPALLAKSDLVEADAQTDIILGGLPELEFQFANQRAKGENTLIKKLIKRMLAVMQRKNAEITRLLPPLFVEGVQRVMRSEVPGEVEVTSSEGEAAAVAATVDRPQSTHKGTSKESKLTKKQQQGGSKLSLSGVEKAKEDKSKGEHPSYPPPATTSGELYRVQRFMGPANALQEEYLNIDPSYRRPSGTTDTGVLPLTSPTEPVLAPVSDPEEYHSLVEDTKHIMSEQELETLFDFELPEADRSKNMGLDIKEGEALMVTSAGAIVMQASEIAALTSAIGAIAAGLHGHTSGGGKIVDTASAGSTGSSHSNDNAIIRQLLPALLEAEKRGDLRELRLIPPPGLITVPDPAAATESVVTDGDDGNISDEEEKESRGRQQDRPVMVDRGSSPFRIRVKASFELSSPKSRASASASASAPSSPARVKRGPSIDSVAQSLVQSKAQTEVIRSQAHSNSTAAANPRAANGTKKQPKLLAKTATKESVLAAMKNVSFKKNGGAKKGARPTKRTTTKGSISSVEEKSSEVQKKGGEEEKLLPGEEKKEENLLPGEEEKEENLLSLEPPDEEASAAAAAAGSSSSPNFSDSDIEAPSQDARRTGNAVSPILDDEEVGSPMVGDDGTTSSGGRPSSRGTIAVSHSEEVIITNPSEQSNYKVMTVSAPSGEGSRLSSSLATTPADSMRTDWEEAEKRFRDRQDLRDKQRRDRRKKRSLRRKDLRRELRKQIEAEDPSAVGDHEAADNLLAELVNGDDDPKIVALGDAAIADFDRLLELDLGGKTLVELTKVVYAMNCNYKYKTLEDIEMEEEADLAKKEKRIVRKAWRAEIHRRKRRRTGREAALRAAAALDHESPVVNPLEVQARAELEASEEAKTSTATEDGEANIDNDDSSKSFKNGGAAAAAVAADDEEEEEVSGSSFVNLDEIDFEDFLEGEEDYAFEDENADLDEFSSGSDDEESSKRYRGSRGSRQDMADEAELASRANARAEWLQLRERMLDLETHVLVIHSAVSLARYRTKSEKYESLLRAFRPFRLLGHMETEGLFYDVLREHIAVIDHCILLAGGWKTVFHILQVECDESVGAGLGVVGGTKDSEGAAMLMAETVGLPDHFRVQILEFYRQRLFHHASYYRKGKRELAKHVSELIKSHRREHEEWNAEVAHLEEKIQKLRAWRKSAQETMTNMTNNPEPPPPGATSSSAAAAISLRGMLDSLDREEEEEKKAEEAGRQRYLKAHGRRALEDKIMDMASRRMSLDSVAASDTNGDGNNSGTMTPEQARGLHAKLATALSSVETSSSPYAADGQQEEEINNNRRSSRTSRLGSFARRGSNKLMNTLGGDQKLLGINLLRQLHNRCDRLVARVLRQDKEGTRLAHHLNILLALWQDGYKEQCSIALSAFKDDCEIDGDFYLFELATALTSLREQDFPYSEELAELVPKIDNAMVHVQRIEAKWKKLGDDDKEKEDVDKPSSLSPPPMAVVFEPEVKREYSEVGTQVSVPGSPRIDGTPERRKRSAVGVDAAAGTENVDPQEVDGGDKLQPMQIDFSVTSSPPRNETQDESNSRRESVVLSPDYDPTESRDELGEPLVLTLKDHEIDGSTIAVVKEDGKDSAGGEHGTDHDPDELSTGEQSRRASEILKKAPLKKRLAVGMKKGIAGRHEKTPEEIAQEFERRVAEKVAEALLAAMPHTAEAESQTVITLGAFEMQQYDADGETGEGQGSTATDSSTDLLALASATTGEKRRAGGGGDLQSIEDMGGDSRAITPMQRVVFEGGMGDSTYPDSKRLRVDGDDQTVSTLGAPDDADDISVHSHGSHTKGGGGGGGGGGGHHYNSWEHLGAPHPALHLYPSHMPPSAVTAYSGKYEIFVTIKSTPDGPRYCFPPGFGLVLVTDDIIELCPGVRLASASHTPVNFELPPGVMYCHRDQDAPLANGLKRLPFHMRTIPKVKGLEALLVPQVIKIAPGVALVPGIALPNNLELPPDVLGVQLAPDAQLPTGVKSVQLSAIFKAPRNLLLPDELTMVQMHTNLTLPAGVIVAPGVEIAETPPNMELPNGLQLVKCSKNTTQLPSFMTRITSSDKGNEESLAQRRIAEGIMVLPKPEGFTFPPGVELVLRPIGYPLPPGMEPLPLSQYPKGLTPKSMQTFVRRSPAYRGGRQLLELVRLTPRYDLPIGACPYPGWAAYARPFDMRLPPSVYLFQVTNERFPAEIPQFLRIVPMPDIPDDVELPSNIVAVEFLPGVQRPLPEGTVLAPGVTVLSTDADDIWSGDNVSVDSKNSGPGGRDDKMMPAPLLAGNSRLPSISRIRGSKSFRRAGATSSNNRSRVISSISGEADPGSVARDDGGRLLLPPHACIVERLPDAVLPPDVEKGSKSSLPSGVLLGENVEIVVLTVRYELPPGASLAPGAVLGLHTQLSPGTVIARDLEVVEWPRGLQLPQGLELVRLLPGCDIMPVGVLPVNIAPNELKVATLPPRCMIIKIPDAVPMSSGQQLAENIEVGTMENLVSDLKDQYRIQRNVLPFFYDAALVQRIADAVRSLNKAMAGEKVLLPPGAVLIRRKFVYSQLPAEMSEVSFISLPQVLRTALEAFAEAMMAREKLDEGSFTGIDVVTKFNSFQSGSAWEVVQLAPQYSLPPGTEIAPGVFVLPKPNWLQVPNWVELVTKIPDAAVGGTTGGGDADDDDEDEDADDDRDKFDDHHVREAGQQSSSSSSGVERAAAARRNRLLSTLRANRVALRPEWKRTDAINELVLGDPKEKVESATARSSRSGGRLHKESQEKSALDAPLNGDGDGDDGLDHDATKSLRSEESEVDDAYYSDEETSLKSHDACGDAFRLPPGAELILCPEDFEVFSWGPNSAGIEAIIKVRHRIPTSMHSSESSMSFPPATATATATVTTAAVGGDSGADSARSPSNINLSYATASARQSSSTKKKMKVSTWLPHGHFLVERPRNQQPPPGLRIGFYYGNDQCAKDTRLPPGVEVMHVCPTFHLPLGVSMRSSSVLFPRLPPQTSLPSNASAMAQVSAPPLLAALNGIHESIQFCNGQPLGPGVIAIAQPGDSAIWFPMVAKSLASLEGQRSSKLSLSTDKAASMEGESNDIRPGTSGNISRSKATLITESEKPSSAEGRPRGNDNTGGTAALGGGRGRPSTPGDELQQITKPIVFVRIYPEAYALPAGALILPDSDEIVNFVFHRYRDLSRDQWGVELPLGFEFTDAERLSGCQLSDILKVVQIPRDIPTPRERLKRMKEEILHTSPQATEDLLVVNPIVSLRQRITGGQMLFGRASKSIFVKDGGKLIVRTRHASFLGDGSDADGTAGAGNDSNKKSKSMRMRMNDGSEVDAHLPSAESLVITLAAAERDALTLESENNKYRVRIAEATADNKAITLRAEQLQNQLEKKILDFNALKKTSQELKYNLTRNEKRVELRFLELSDARAKYMELDKRTAPLIASLKTKLAMWQSEGETDMNAKWLQSEAAKKERAEAVAREKALRFAALQAIDTMRKSYKEIMACAVKAFAQLSTYIAVEAAARQDSSRLLQTSILNSIIALAMNAQGPHSYGNAATATAAGSIGGGDRLGGGLNPMNASAGDQSFADGSQASSSTKQVNFAPAPTTDHDLLSVLSDELPPEMPFGKRNPSPLSYDDSASLGTGASSPMAKSSVLSKAPENSEFITFSSRMIPVSRTAKPGDNKLPAYSAAPQNMSYYPSVPVDYSQGGGMEPLGNYPPIYLTASNFQLPFATDSLIEAQQITEDINGDDHEDNLGSADDASSVDGPLTSPAKMAVTLRAWLNIQDIMRLVGIAVDAGASELAVGFKKSKNARPTNGSRQGDRRGGIINRRASAIGHSGGAAGGNKSEPDTARSGVSTGDVSLHSMESSEKKGPGAVPLPVRQITPLKIQPRTSSSQKASSSSSSSVPTGLPIDDPEADEREDAQNEAAFKRLFSTKVKVQFAVKEFDVHLQELVDRVVDLLKSAGRAERERFQHAMSLAERETRLSIRKMHASEFRADRTKLLYERLAAKMDGRLNVLGGHPHQSDPSSISSPMRSDNTGVESLESVAVLKEEIERIREKKEAPVLKRLKGVADDVREMLEMETGLRLYSMAMKSLAMQERKKVESVVIDGGGADGDDDKKGGLKDSTTTGTTAAAAASGKEKEIKESERSAVMHRAESLQEHAQALSSRADSLHKEIDDLRMDMMRELQSYENVCSTVLSSESRDIMRRWANQHQQDAKNRMKAQAPTNVIANDAMQLVEAQNQQHQQLQRDRQKHRRGSLNHLASAGYMSPGGEGSVTSLSSQQQQSRSGKTAKSRSSSSSVRIKKSAPYTVLEPLLSGDVTAQLSLLSSSTSSFFGDDGTVSPRRPVLQEKAAKRAVMLSSATVQLTLGERPTPTALARSHMNLNNVPYHVRSSASSSSIGVGAYDPLNGGPSVGSLSSWVSSSGSAVMGPQGLDTRGIRTAQGGSNSIGGGSISTAIRGARAQMSSHASQLQQQQQQVQQAEPQSRWNSLSAQQQQQLQQQHITGLGAAGHTQYQNNSNKGNSRVNNRGPSA